MQVSLNVSVNLHRTRFFSVVNKSNIMITLCVYFKYFNRGKIRLMAIFFTFNKLFDMEERKRELLSRLKILRKKDVKLILATKKNLFLFGQSENLDAERQFLAEINFVLFAFNYHITNLSASSG